MKNSIKIVLAIALGALLTYWFMKKQFSSNVQTMDADVLIERIKSVKKIIVTEAYFSEVYNYKEAQKYFYDLLSFEKKALLLVKGKVQVSYDLTKMEYTVDNDKKLITITKIPNPETTIEPSIKYYDLKESTFNSFSSADYNKLNLKAIEKLKEEIDKSGIKKMAEKSLATAIDEMQWVGKELGWKIVYKTKT